MILVNSFDKSIFKDYKHQYHNNPYDMAIFTSKSFDNSTVPLFRYRFLYLKNYIFFWALFLENFLYYYSRVSFSLWVRCLFFFKKQYCFSDSQYFFKLNYFYNNFQLSPKDNFYSNVEVLGRSFIYYYYSFNGFVFNFFKNFFLKTWLPLFSTRSSFSKNFNFFLSRHVQVLDCYFAKKRGGIAFRFFYKKWKRLAFLDSHFCVTVNYLSIYDPHADVGSGINLWKYHEWLH